MYCTALDPDSTTEYECLAALQQHIKQAHLSDLAICVSAKRHGGYGDALMAETRRKRVRRRYSQAASSGQGERDRGAGHSSGGGAPALGQGGPREQLVRQSDGALLQGRERQLPRVGAGRRHRIWPLAQRSGRQSRRKCWFSTRASRSQVPPGVDQLPPAKRRQTSIAEGPVGYVVEGQDRERGESSGDGNHGLPSGGTADEQQGQKGGGHGDGGGTSRISQGSLCPGGQGSTGESQGDHEGARGRNQKRPCTEDQSHEKGTATLAASQNEREVRARINVLQDMPEMARPPGLDQPNDTQDALPAIGEDPEASLFDEPAMAHPTGLSSQMGYNRVMGDTQDIFPVVGEDPVAWLVDDHAAASSSSSAGVREAVHGVASNEDRSMTVLPAMEDRPGTATDPTGAVPRRRCRAKTSTKQLQLQNNIRVAHNSPPTDPANKQIAVVQARALVTRGDLLTTSVYIRYHRNMGHTPPRITSVRTQHRKRLLQDNNIPIDNLQNTRVFLVQDKSIQHKKSKNQHPQ